MEYNDQSDFVLFSCANQSHYILALGSYNEIHAVNVSDTTEDLSSIQGNFVVEKGFSIAPQTHCERWDRLGTLLYVLSSWNLPH